MVKTAHLYPGLFFRSYSMADGAFSHPLVQRRLTEASLITNRDLKQTCRTNSPYSDLTDCFVYTIAASVAIAEVYQQQNPAPDAVLGSSLGHYSALVMLGSLKYEATIKLMQQCGAIYDNFFQQYSTIVTQLLPLEQSTRYFGDLLEGLLLVCDYSDGTAFTGPREIIEQISARLFNLGFKSTEQTCLRLPFHSDRLQEAEKATHSIIEAAAILPPSSPLYSTFAATAITEPEEIKNALKHLLSSPHLLYRTYLLLKNIGYRDFIHMRSFNAVKKLEIM